MPANQSTEAKLRRQIAANLVKLYPTSPIESRIATELLTNGRFEDALDAAELEIILRNVIYTLIAEQKVAGIDVTILHNVHEIDVVIEDGEAKVSCLVHIHSPIIAFINFAYTLVNNGDPGDRIMLKPGTLAVSEKTRRFDLKAKTALAALNVKRIALHEMSDMAGIIQRTLPPQLEAQGVVGTFAAVQLSLKDKALCVCLEGEFAPVKTAV